LRKEIAGRLPKEIASNVYMLIDLGRNDAPCLAKKLARWGMSGQNGVERYSHGMHIVSNVSRASAWTIITPLDVLRGSRYQLDIKRARRKSARWKL